MTKDYSLLRPFDLEAAKAGEPVTLYNGGALKATNAGGFVAGPNARGEFILDFDDSGYRLYEIGQLGDGPVYMAPLAWVEGKPVYKGDVLWHKDYRFALRAMRWAKLPIIPEGWIEGVVRRASSGSKPQGEPAWAPVSVWSWNPPKIKRDGWVNISTLKGTNDLLSAEVSHAYRTEELANRYAPQGRVACTRVEWEE